MIIFHTCVHLKDLVCVNMHPISLENRSIVYWVKSLTFARTLEINYKVTCFLNKLHMVGGQLQVRRVNYLLKDCCAEQQISKVSKCYKHCGTCATGDNINFAITCLYWYKVHIDCMKNGMTPLTHPPPSSARLYEGFIMSTERCWHR